MQAYIHIQPLQWKFLTGFKSIDLTLSTKAYSHNWFTIQFIQICKSHNSKNHNLITQPRIHKHTIEHSTFLIIIPRYISLYPNITIDCFPSLSNSTPYNLSIQYNSTNFDQHNRKLTSHTHWIHSHTHTTIAHTLCRLHHRRRPGLTSRLRTIAIENRHFTCYARQPPLTTSIVCVPFIHHN